MIEVEVKVRADIDEVRQRLEEIGAERHGSKTQVDTYYSAPHRDFAETDEALRIRRLDGETRLTYKGPKLDTQTKSREEFELEVGDDDTMDSVLTSLGFEEFETVRKEREVYEVDGYHVLLDDVDGVGEFVEVEREADEASLDDARDGVKHVLEEVGLDPGDSITTSYLGLLVSQE